MVGIIATVTYWSKYLEEILSDDAKGISVVIESQCGQNFTFVVDGAEANYTGRGDRHDPTYDHLVVSAEINVERKGTQLNTEVCSYTIKVYPSDATRDVYVTNKPGVYTLIVVIVFLFALLIFIIYDILVEKRQRRVEKAALENRKIVASLFPSAVRDRMFKNSDEEKKKQRELKNAQIAMPMFGGAGNRDADEQRQANVTGLISAANLQESASLRIKNFLSEKNSTQKDDKQPIADLFPNTTVFFGDIAGFTSWSSQREPTQVFTLLQTLYQAFDRLAKKLGVFKIETIGDCYVACTGLPDPQADHAVRMAFFARESLRSMQGLVKKLEVNLGPDTAELCLRVGLHSGPVTAGVLRGESSLETQ
jgi:class 3 adenylate cyclase